MRDYKMTLGKTSFSQNVSFKKLYFSNELQPTEQQKFIFQKMKL